MKKSRSLWLILLFLSCTVQQSYAQSSAWTCYVSDFSSGRNVRLPNQPICNFIGNGQLYLSPQLAGSNNYFVNYDYIQSMCLSENFEYQIRLRNTPTDGGQAQYDIGFGLETPIGTRMSCSLMSDEPSGQPFTNISLGGQTVLANSPLLVRPLRTWGTMRMRVENRVFSLFHDNTLVYTAPFNENICTLKGLWTYFKGSGAIDFIKIINLDNNDIIYNEEFNSCLLLATPAPCPRISVVPTAAPICEGDTLKIVTSISGYTGTRAASFEWSGPNGFSTNQPSVVISKANRSAGGIYRLNTTFNACNIINSSITPRINLPPVVNLGKDTVVCTPSNINLNAGIGGTYRWNDSLTTRLKVVNQSGIYMVTVTSIDGCSAADTIQIDIPISPVNATISVKKPTCFGRCNGEIRATGTGGFGAPFTYQWTGISEQGSLVTDLCANDYSVTVSDAKGCPHQTLISLTQPSKITLVARSAYDFNGFAVHCAEDSDGSATAKAQGGAGGFRYQWRTLPAQDTPTAVNLTAGSYRVVVTDRNGCKDSAVVNLVAPKPLAVDYDIKNVRCYGEKNGYVTFKSASGGVSPYSINFNNQLLSNRTTKLDSLGAANYPLTIKDENGCLLKYDLHIIEPAKLKPFTTPDTLIHFGDDVQLTVGLATPSVLTAVKWTANRDSINIACANCRQTTFSPRVTTLFRVTLTDSFGCDVRREIIVHVDKKRKIFSPNIFSPNNDGKNDRFCIFSGPGTRRILKYQVFNRWGMLMYQAKDLALNDETNCWDGTFQGRECEVGTYVWFAEIAFEDGDVEILKGDVTLVR